MSVEVTVSEVPKNTPFLMKKWGIALFFALLTALAGAAAYYKIFTGLNPYDDEGTLMLSVKQYLGGMKLYDQLFSGYGPVYYFYDWALRTLSATPVTHNVVRISSIIPWLLCSLICALIVLRLTESAALAFVAHFLVFSSLSFFVNEPGHPQELCILLLASLVACGFFVAAPRWRFVGIILMGALTAALLLTKINIGIFMILAVALALLTHVPKNALVRSVLIITVVAALALPLTLMKAHLHDALTQRYCFVVEASIIALLMGLRHTGAKDVRLSISDCFFTLLSFMVTVAGILMVLFLHGISLSSILYSLVLSNVKVSVSLGLWYIPFHLGWVSVPWTIAGLSLAVYFNRERPNQDSTTSALQISVLKLVIAVMSVIVFVVSRQALLALVTPFSWLVLHDPTEEDGSTLKAFPRSLLCSIAVLQTLYAYPIAGSQASFIEVMLLVVSMTCLGDFLLWQERTGKYRLASRTVVQLFAAALILCVPMAYGGTIYHQRKIYDSLPPLRIAGADRIHLPEKRIREYEWLVQNLKENCDVFVGLPEIPSLHLWTATEPVAGLYVDDWILTYTGGQQIAVVDELSKHANACAVYNPDLVGFWNRSKQDLNVLPLVSYIRNNFRVVGQADQYFLLVRNERKIALNSLPAPVNDAYDLRQ